MSQVIDDHTCFIPALPQLPIGYKFDSNRPFQLVPFDQFAHILEAIDICKKCYNRATTTYHLEYLNRDSAKRTVESPAAVALGGMSRFAGVVNSCAHPMFNELYPPTLREGRRLSTIINHEARKGNATGRPRLLYVIKYQICEDPRLLKTRVDETRLRQYGNAVDILQSYWYGNHPHSINTPFVRSVLNRLSPFANSAVWNKLPIDESLLLHYLHQNGRMHEWKPGMSIKQYIGIRRDSA